MKKQFLLLAGAALILASCGGETKTEDKGQSQAQIDSAVNAQVAAHEAETARIEDSTKQAVAAQRVTDSLAAAEAAAATKKPAGTKKPKTPKAEPVTPPPPPPPPATIGNGKPKMGGQTTTDPNSGGTIGNGKPKMGK